MCVHIYDIYNIDSPILQSNNSNDNFNYEINFLTQN